MAQEIWQYDAFHQPIENVFADGPEPILANRVIVEELPVAQLLISYAVLIPLLVFAVHGGFAFEHGSWNSNLGAVGGKIAVVSSSSENLRDSLQSWISLSLCLALAIPYYRSFAVYCRRMPLMLALPIYAMTSACWSQDAWLTLRSSLSLLVMTIFAFYLDSRFSHRQQLQLVMFAGACVGVGSVMLALFWPQYGIDHQLHEGAWQGLFTQKNVCAEATLFLLTPALAFPSEGRYGQMLRAVYIVLCLGIILLSQSRTGWAMTGVYLAFAFCLRVLGKFERRDLLPLTALLFAIIGCLLLAIVIYPSLALSLVERSDSFSGRSQIWKAVGVSILRRPIGGYGYDAFWSLLQGEVSRVFAATGWVVTSAHNGFLNVGLELGVVGLALIAATLVLAFRHACTAYRPGHSPYVEWCIGIVFLTVVYNLDERTLLATQYLPWVLYILACAGLRDAAWERSDDAFTAHSEWRSQ